MTSGANTRVLRTAGGPADETSAAEATIFIAVVHAADGVRFTAAVPSRRELVAQLAGYTRRRAAHVLEPDHARHFRALIAREELEGAVEVYFGLVGARWDKEWLVTTACTAADCPPISARVGAVAVEPARSA
jgi:hypothetical protein